MTGDSMRCGGPSVIARHTELIYHAGAMRKAESKLLAGPSYMYDAATRRLRTQKMRMDDIVQSCQMVE
jgi:hypothetical protein